MLLLLSALLACQAPCGDVLHTASPHAIEVTFGASEGTSVRYTAAGRTQTAAVDGSGRAMLTGLPPLTEVAYWLLDDNGQSVCSEATTSWNLPSGLPTLTTTTHDLDKSAEHVLVGTLIGETATLFAIDREGRWLWHHQLEEGLTAVDVHLVEGEEPAILHNVFEAEFSEDVGEIRWLDLSGQQTASLRTPGAHHVFEPTPHGSFVYPAVDIRDWYDEKRDEWIVIVGDRLMEITPDGTTTELFNVWDHEDPIRHDQWHAGFYSDGYDWTHANAVSHSADRSSYLLSLGHLDAIYEIDADSGAPIQRISAEWVTRGDTAFAFQHDPHWTEDGTLMMLSYTDDLSPVALEYTVNTQGERLAEVWSEESDASGLALLGQARRLPGGNVLINFGGKGIIQELTPEGEVVWELSSPLGTWFGNVRIADALF